MSEANVVETRVPARIDRLLWSRWHRLVIVALGVTWILDGVEITIQGNIADTLTNPRRGLVSVRPRSDKLQASTSPGPARGLCSSLTSPTGTAGGECS